MRLPILLDSTFAEKRRLNPSELSVELPLRDVCTASVTLPGTDSALQMHDWVDIFVNTGSVGLFRVTDLGKESEGRTIVTLRHAIDTLSDAVWVPTNTGETENFEGTVAEFLAALLDKQKTAYWQLGACADTAAWKRDGVSYARLSDLLNEVVQDQIDYYLTFDFSTSPWTLNFVALPTTVTGEFRLSRNVETADVRRSDGDMCNRLHLSASTTTTDSGGHKTTSVVYGTYDNVASQALYGIIEQTANVDTAYVPVPSDWAQEFLDRRADPAIQISIEGYELKALTGQSWDTFSRGQKVRVILGPLGERITTRVEAITYPDVLNQPERVTVELANRLPKFTSAIAQMQKVTKAVGGGASRGTGRGYASASEIKQWSMILTDVEEAVDGTGILQMWQSGIVIDAQQGVTIHSLYQGFESQYSAIKVNSDKIELLVDGNNNIKAASIVLAINQAGSSVTITGDHVVVDAQQTTLTGKISAMDANFTNLTTGQTEAQSIKAGILNARSAFLFDNETVTWQEKIVLDGNGSPRTIHYLGKA